jgi:glutathione S-transferase
VSASYDSNSGDSGLTISLYYAPTACSLVPYLTLTEAGADFEVININIGKSQHLDATYRRLNPKHKVPMLLIDGEPLTENVAIQIWIARNFPKAGLLPREPLQEIKAISFLAWCASGIHPSLTPNARPEQYCDLPGSEDSVRRCAQLKLFENYQIADDLLKGREWFFDHFTAADAYFFWCFRRGLIFKLDLSRFENCHAHFERMKLRASVEKVFAYEASVLKAFAKND